MGLCTSYSEQSLSEVACYLLLEFDIIRSSGLNYTDGQAVAIHSLLHNITGVVESFMKPCFDPEP